MDHPEFLTAKELASRLGLEVATFNRMVAIGDLPHGIDITGKGRLKMWPSGDVEGIRWMLLNKHRMRRSTPEEEEAAATDD